MSSRRARHDIGHLPMLSDSLRIHSPPRPRHCRLIHGLSILLSNQGNSPPHLPPLIPPNECLGIVWGSQSALCRSSPRPFFFALLLIFPFLHERKEKKSIPKVPRAEKPVFPCGGYLASFPGPHLHHKTPDYEPLMLTREGGTTRDAVYWRGSPHVGVGWRSALTERVKLNLKPLIPELVADGLGDGQRAA
ncbi:hypothetical protein LX32DRAFT_261762 [Colletotrichum zoysiae]|uniref:Uncharacterized protein n=1 Tax=Colletotrichum zoysiae TaxID=1216348 RepID=A0AAD9HM05_9PEZI|nr:hypothetical protein LX32DRAFT_261762 [Colletotrichum zoysiae]